MVILIIDNIHYVQQILQWIILEVSEVNRGLFLLLGKLCKQFWYLSGILFLLEKRYLRNAIYVQWLALDLGILEHIL